MLKAILLGIVQGITEFLPVSSSAHLVIAEKLINISPPGLAFEVTLHLASIIALIYYFNSELWEIIIKSAKYFFNKTEPYRYYFSITLFLIIATFMTGIVGITINSILSDNIKNLLVVGISLLITGGLLIFVENSLRFQFIFVKHERDLSILDAFFIGACQGISIIPGISRSGMTITSAIYRGYSKNTAVKLSFLLAFPVIMGSFIFHLPELIYSLQADLLFMNHSSINKFQLGTAFISCFFASLIGIKWLIKIITDQKLTLFSCYVIILGILAIVSEIIT